MERGGWNDLFSVMYLLLSDKVAPERECLGAERKERWIILVP